MRACQSGLIRKPLDGVRGSSGKRAWALAREEDYHFLEPARLSGITGDWEPANKGETKENVGEAAASVGEGKNRDLVIYRKEKTTEM